MLSTSDKRGFRQRAHLVKAAKLELTSEQELLPVNGAAGLGKRMSARYRTEPLAPTVVVVWTTCARLSIKFARSWTEVEPGGSTRLTGSTRLPTDVDVERIGFETTRSRAYTYLT